MSSDGAAELRRERDLYLRLLRLGEEDDLERFLDEALALVVEVTGARRGYVELFDPAGSDEPRFWTSFECSAAELDQVRAKVSRGIVAEAIARGETIATASAFLDPRFQASKSVQDARIEAVLCGPIGYDPPFGVVYLEGRVSPGPFDEAARQRVELFGRLVSPLADRLMTRHSSLEAQDATQELRKRFRLDGLTGRGRTFEAVLRQLMQVAPLDVDVLLLGESGTGKSQLARALHANSPRMNQPFVEVNCAAIPESLFENELFGHVPGAYTGAQSAADGKLAAAHRGTLLLDEVGEIPLQLQAKLLQFLQSRQYARLGSSQMVGADVRVIAATNLDLQQAVRERRFRDDLYYRLRVLPIRIPTLDERREDIAELAERFCDDTCNRHGFPRLSLTRGALQALAAADWPGNVRQLQHAVEAAVIHAVSDNARKVEVTHFSEEDVGVTGESKAETFATATHAFQRTLVLRTLEATDWNVAEAARRLDLARSYLYTLIKEHQLSRS